jgi:hypothetical protein
MKYLWSGILSSLKTTCLSLEYLKGIGWTGGLSYGILMIASWCILMATFPGYSDLAKFLKWYHKTCNPIRELSYIIWAVFNTIGTIVTISGIQKIMKTLKELKNNNPIVKTNYFNLTLHALVLTLNLIPTIVICIPE